MRILYRIINKINQKVYIGQTGDFKRRMKYHRSCKTSLIGIAIKKYGKENFTYEILGEYEDSQIDNAERQAIIDNNSIRPNGYNLESGGCQLKTLHEESKKKISLKKKGSSPAPNKGGTSWSKGLHLSDEHKANISKANTGKKRLNVKPISEEHKKAISIKNKGKIRTEENKKKISDTLKAKYALMTPEERSLKCGAQKGKPRTEEEKRKISEGSKGKKLTPEHKQNSINGIKAFYASMTAEQRKEYVQNKFKKKR